MPPTKRRHLEGVWLLPRENDAIAVRVTEPQLAMMRIGVNVHRSLHLGASVRDPVECSIQIRQFEPHGHTISPWNSGLGQRAMVSVAFSGVQLEDELVVVE